MSNITEIYEQAQIFAIKKKYYDALKVDALVEKLLEEVEYLKEKNDKIYSGKAEIEELIGQTKETAEKNIEQARAEADEIVQNGVTLSSQILQDAKDESEKIISAAEKKADEIIESAVIKAAEIRERAGKTIYVRKSDAPRMKTDAGDKIQRSAEKRQAEIELNLKKIIKKQEETLTLLNYELNRIKTENIEINQSQIRDRLNAIAKDIDYINGDK